MCPRPRAFLDPQEDAGRLLQVLVSYENIMLNLAVHCDLLNVIKF